MEEARDRWKSVDVSVIPGRLYLDPSSRAPSPSPPLTEDLDIEMVGRFTPINQESDRPTVSTSRESKEGYDISTSEMPPVCSTRPPSPFSHPSASPPECQVHRRRTTPCGGTSRPAAFEANRARRSSRDNRDGEPLGFDSGGQLRESEPGGPRSAGDVGPQAGRKHRVSRSKDFRSQNRMHLSSLLLSEI